MARGEGLLALYDYVQDRLVHANVTKSAALVAEAIDLLEPLRDAFTRAAATAEAS
ncbi:flagellar protein FliS [Phycicoccus sp. HDW14]|uniref:flagellar protein FliS n=1 Tax=Phycicoccus sp. HDW14 TaxID=2714941 RepID=UPI003530148A